MQVINFSKNWNKKLNADYFTTIRLPGSKYTPGNVLMVYCKDEYIYDAKIQHSKEILLKQLTQYDTLIDAGMDRVDFMYMMKKMYPKYDFEVCPIVVLLLKQLGVPEKPSIPVPKVISYPKLIMEEVEKEQVKQLEAF